MFNFNGQTYSPDRPFIGIGAGLNKELNLGTFQTHLQYADGATGGAITPDSRSDNGGKCEDYSRLFGLNSWGMPNSGKNGVPNPNTEDDWQEVRDRIILNIAGFEPMDYDLLIRMLAGRFGGFELNFGCPNVRIDGKQKKIVSFDPENMARILDLVGAFETSDSILVKLSPYSDPGMLEEIAAVINEAKRPRLGHIVKAVVNGNSFANGRGYLIGEPMVDTEAAGMYGGVTGEALKPISLGNAAKFRELLDPEISVIRCGGVSTGMDVWESTQVGCDGVEVVTAIQNDSPQLIEEMRKQYEALAA